MHLKKLQLRTLQTKRKQIFRYKKCKTVPHKMNPTDLYRDIIIKMARVKVRILKAASRSSLAARWIGFHTSTAGGQGLIPGQRTRIPQAVWHSQKRQSRVTYKEKLISLSADFSTEMLQDRREWQDKFKVLKILQPRILYTARLSFRRERISQTSKN